MSVTTMQEPIPAPSITAVLLPIMGVVFVGFLVIGMAMPVLPLHVHDGLGFGTFAVGLVAGSQFGASMIRSSPAWQLESQACGPTQRAFYPGLRSAFGGEADMNRDLAAG